MLHLFIGKLILTGPQLVARKVKVTAQTKVKVTAQTKVKVTAQTKNMDLKHMETAIFYQKIKHDSFPSLSKGENHGTVLEFSFNFSNVIKKLH